MHNTDFFLEHVGYGVTDVARQTVDCLGEERANQFSIMSVDSAIIVIEIHDQYEQADLFNLVYAQLSGLLKELKWLQFLFLAGNYPLVTGRLRYLWEAMYRAYFVETHEDEDVRLKDIDAKLQWIEDQKPRLDWKNCVEPALFRAFPLSKAEREVQTHYKALWDELNQYVHPSQYLQSRMVGETSLLVADNFDHEWAEDTLRASVEVVDLIFVAVLAYHANVIESDVAVRLNVEYPMTQLIVKK